GICCWPKTTAIASGRASARASKISWSVLNGRSNDDARRSSRPLKVFAISSSRGWTRPLAWPFLLELVSLVPVGIGSTFSIQHRSFRLSETPNSGIGLRRLRVSRGAQFPSQSKFLINFIHDQQREG